jgi:hypothetical protein
LARFTKLSRDPRRNMDELVAMLAGNGSDPGGADGASSAY